MKKVIIDTSVGESMTASSKAREDILTTSKQNGYDAKLISIDGSTNKFSLLKEIYFTYQKLKKILDDVEDGSTVIIQYPWDSMLYQYAKFIQKKAQLKNLKTIVLIHDINSIRTNNLGGKIYFKYFVKEIKFLTSFDYIISHNEKMTRYLIEQGIPKNKIYDLGIFDYLTDKSNINDFKNFKSVTIAGNLSVNKSKYIYELDKLNGSHYHFELYGVHYTNPSSKFLVYNGAFPAEELPLKIHSGFGLVWDGSSTDTCDGTFGNYLKYNNPHKFSLYMACGIPVIVWKESALAQFVTSHQIGIVISSLEELDECFRTLTLPKYKEMVENVKKIQKNVKNGYYFSTVIRKIEKK